MGTCCLHFFPPQPALELGKATLCHGSCTLQPIILHLAGQGQRQAVGRTALLRVTVQMGLSDLSTLVWRVQ